ncbi:type IX secretion system membrane protein PorP/SprF [Niastella caeni]|uniref:Type IX secretion system membrane protein PorP/SprF n=1 Tax=Niastella caeni TaxID=2569763 RepID=A0A4S8I344_9BACT|nr:PorP/SprF family type IX secretion system membrane protein [Niastella caeni]THU40432.1 type IX secretion system membrane protein PorP/SprF [Niastella caeni]
MRNSIILLTLFLSVQAVKAQVDPHFSQYYVYPAWLNPALTGAFDGDYRISGIYRSQWGNISSPFTTPGVAVDFTTNKNSNFGASVLNQTAGDGGYNYLTAYASYAYNGVRFGPQENHRVVMGMQIGVIQRRFNRSKLTFGDQWNPITGYNPGAISAEAFSKTSSTSFDAAAGILYYDAQPGKRMNLFGGFAVSHLTRPDDKFSESGKARLPMRYTGHAGVRITLSDVLSLTPNILYLKQGSATEKMVGAYARLIAAPGTDVMLGANYRFKDALSPFVGFAHKNIVLGVSYDVNTSTLGKMANGSNSFEISLSFIGRRSVKTPEVDFVCPRL